MKNKRLALKLLAKDCELAHQYVQGGKTCAVGCLALASGVSRRTLIRYGKIWISDGRLFFVAARIQEKFSLSTRQLELIQETNDRCTTTADRRKAVLKVVRAIN